MGCIMERVIKVPLSEIALIRFVCKVCKAGVDVPVDRLAKAKLTCPACGHESRRPDIDGAIINFAAGLCQLQNSKEIEVQFVIPLSQ
jgi:hypothetical protein